jgi:hypothetical protein
MSTVITEVTLTTLCFPDITGATQGAWGTVTFASGFAYAVGGIPFGLVAYADARTINVDGFLQCTVIDEQASTPIVYTFRYVPSTDALQIYQNGIELTAGPLPAYLLTDASIIFHANWNRTEMLG